ncbi:YfcZ/YiiS family protein [Shewanella submarina]|uniref:DUF406 family protein n=1 Tax=Shewanella submarina TaxID=2016376 RepID=A0ABV7GGP6_9GAMM|nr:DUF406 family protein [Shewanella submarina]MCL1038268.1 YfcZ/YiiS family protein [Shewanella submarina]
MKAIRDAQSDAINDTCTYCGSFVDVGAVIEADDTELKVNFAGDDAHAQAEALAQRAISRFAKTQFAINPQADGVELVLTFDVSVEKMIFQLSI